MDIFNKTVKTIDHNRWTFLGIALSIAISSIVIGCESKTVSLIDSSRTVDRHQYELEWVSIRGQLDKQKAVLDQMIVEYNTDVATADARYEKGVQDLNLKDQRRAELVDAGGGIIMQATSGSLNPVSVIMSILGMIGIFGGAGTVADNRRKDKIIKSKTEKIV